MPYQGQEQRRSAASGSQYIQGRQAVMGDMGDKLLLLKGGLEQVQSWHRHLR